MGSGAKAVVGPACAMWSLLVRFGAWHWVATGGHPSAGVRHTTWRSRISHGELESQLLSGARPVPLSVLGLPCVSVPRSVGSTGDAAPRLCSSEARGLCHPGPVQLCFPLAGPLLRCHTVCRDLRESQRKESWASLSKSISLKEYVWHAVLPFKEPWGGHVSAVRGHSGWDRQRAPTGRAASASAPAQSGLALL